MKPVALLATAVALTLSGCTESPTDPPEPTPTLSVIGADNPRGAIVLNQGEASGDHFGTCSFLSSVTHDVTVVRNPSGGGKLSCHWDDFGQYPRRAVTQRGFGCVLDFFGISVTTKSHFVLSPTGHATLSCHFPKVA